MTGSRVAGGPAPVWSSWPFLLAGSACIVAGGLVSAATAPQASEHSAWAAAYLVLVAGVVQIALGAGQALLAPRGVSRPLLVAELVTWNVGNAAVLAGTLLQVAAVVDLGGALLVCCLGLVVLAVRRPGKAGWPAWVFRALVVVVLVSIPIGLVLGATSGG
ncbi:MAG TPA: hypothetical protein VFI30_01525 [Nocardioidaceae bacterium]|nr:hypothetical protein [Nocardioidaceae bacterium]